MKQKTPQRRCLTLFSLFMLSMFFTNTIQAQRRINTNTQNPIISATSCNHVIINGELWAWGSQESGVLGNGTIGGYQSSPIKIGSANNWMSISGSKVSNSGGAGTGYRMAALQSDGTLWSWGVGFIGSNNTNGQDAFGIPLLIGQECKKIAVGTSHSLVIMSDGTLWGWGSDLLGQLGIDGLSTAASVPTLIDPSGNWVDVAANYNSSFAIKADGTLWGWGKNDVGQLGNGTTTTLVVPTQIGTDHDWIHVSTGGNLHPYTMAIKSDGSLWGWGRGNGIGDGSFTTLLSPTKITNDNDWVNVQTGNGATLALKANGTLWACGYNLFGGTTTWQTSLIQIGTESNWINISSGNNFSLALKADGSVWSWSQSIPVNVSGSITASLNSWKSTSSGQFFTTGVKTDGSLWSWGANSYGQLGLGTTTNQNTPTRIGTENNWTVTSAGENHVLALKANGTLWAWGDNLNGKLGNGNATNQSNPVQITSDQDWIAVAGGYNHSLALKANGTVWAWGANGNGQFGNGSTTSSNVPVQVGVERWIAITAGTIHSHAIKGDGSLWAWGYNYFGQLGDGTNTESHVPVQVGNQNHWTAVSAGYHYMLALRSNGTLWGCGLNENGQLGFGVLTNQNSPVRIGPDAPTNVVPPGGILTSLGLWRFIAASKYNTSHAVKSNGTLWAWGINGNGQFGRGNRDNSDVPVQIGTDKNWMHISGGGFFKVAIRSTRSQYCFSGYGLGLDKLTLTCY